MTVIHLGTVALHIGMTRYKAEQADEQIRRKNHGKSPVDNSGKPLQTNTSLFELYDTNKDGVIGNDEYQKYRNDLEKKFNSMLDETAKEVKDIITTLKVYNDKNENKPQTKIL